jgi:serine/threonine protein phosphatase PrpC
MRSLAISLDGDQSDPACTIVSAACLGGALTVGWAGDSRAYWIGETELEQLTLDNSWAYEQVAAGAMSEAQASADPRAHAITRWLGADAPEHPHQIITRRPPERGTLVLCSDGLWNYAPDPSDIARLIRALPDAASPLAVARSLTDAALAGGARDNITVAVVDVRPTGR